jgi:hypothetical protein
MRTGLINWPRVLLAGAGLIVSLKLYDRLAVPVANLISPTDEVSLYFWGYIGVAFAIALPMWWYFLKEKGGASTGSAVGAVMTIMAWFVGTVSGLPMAIFVYLTQFRYWHFDWAFADLLWSIPVCAGIGAVVGWIAECQQEIRPVSDPDQTSYFIRKARGSLPSPNAPPRLVGVFFASSVDLYEESSQKHERGSPPVL